ncbi:MAG: hypothetical protein K0R26_1960 [Bacteroidota bacterium]|jgi:hypothetical protein|nr:hypothetical protein [Bacteroidota bacterium]
MEKSNLITEIYKKVLEKFDSIQLELANNNFADVMTDEGSQNMGLRKFCTDLEPFIHKHGSDPAMMLNLFTRNKTACKKNRNEAISAGDNYAVKKYQRAIDEVLDPLMDSFNKVIERQLRANLLNPDKIASDLTKKVEVELSLSGDMAKKCLPSFKQIHCNATEKEILDFFMILFKTIHHVNGKPLMEENDVIDFVHNNFAIFGKSYSQKYYSINIVSKAALTYFLYQFYQKYDYNNTNNKIKYAGLLIMNFEQFAKENPRTLCSNMSSSKRPKNGHNLIDVEQYLSAFKG